MPKVKVIDTTGKEVKQIELPVAIFEADVNQNLIAQAIRIRMYNAWLGTRKTKSRGEVSGGGRKPWRQKGTGRARHGSTRSPIWVGGGHAHPLIPAVNTLKFPRKMRRKALFSALSAKLSAGEVVVMENVAFKNPSVKEAQKLVDAVEATKKILFILAKKDDILVKSFNNLPGIRVIEARLLHSYDILHCDKVVFFEDSIPILEETFVK